MDGQGLRMCRFTRDGIPELGEYLESVDGTGICKLTELDGGGEEVVVCLPQLRIPVQRRPDSRDEPATQRLRPFELAVRRQHD